MHKVIILSILLFFGLNTGCVRTKYVEKQSEPLSQSVYAVKDSIDNKRIDLADYYSSESVKLIEPPKKRIDIKPIYQKSSVGEKTITVKTSNQPILIVPSNYKGAPVIVVNTEEYNALKQNKETAKQLIKEKDDLQNAKTNVEIELQNQKDIHNQMVKDLADKDLEIKHLKSTILDKNMTIFKRTAFIVAMFAGIGIYIVIKIRGLIPF